MSNPKFKKTKIKLDKDRDIIINDKGEMLINTTNKNKKKVKLDKLNNIIENIQNNFPESDKKIFIDKLTKILEQLSQLSDETDEITTSKNKNLIGKTLNFVFHQSPEFIDFYSLNDYGK